MLFKTFEKNNPTVANLSNDNEFMDRLKTYRTVTMSRVVNALNTIESVNKVNLQVKYGLDDSAMITDLIEAYKGDAMFALHIVGLNKRVDLIDEIKRVES